MKYMHNYITMKLQFKILLFGLLCFANSAVGQNKPVSVSASIDSTLIMIGDQARLTFQIGQDADKTVMFPIIEEELIKFIEVVERSKPDTTDLGQNRIEISQTYTITSFEDSLYYIPPFAFVSGTDTSWSPSLSLGVVQPFEIDTTNAITDIKGIYDAPINWGKILRIALIVLLAIALCVLVYYLYQKHKPAAKGQQELSEPVRPAHEVAIEELERIKTEKIWQQHGREKVYYTQLTDTLRQYIDSTYYIGSMEMTSEEILEFLRPEFREDKVCFDSLKKILNLADLVKFAKWRATPDEHEMCLNNAFKFVKETMPTEQVETENTKEGEPIQQA